MKKIFFLLLAAVFVLGFLTGCEETDSQTGDKVTPYIGGTAGLSIQFGEGAPPDEVFDRGQYPFDIDVKLLNVGEADIAKEDVKVIITG